MDIAAKDRSNGMRISKAISHLIYIQSLIIFGFFTLRAIPHFLRVLGKALHPDLIITSEVASILIAVCLIMLARGISLRRKRAWQVALILQASLLGTSSLRALNYFLRNRHEALIYSKAIGLTHLVLQVAILVLLIKHRGLFKTYSDPLTRVQAGYFLIRNFILFTFVGFVIVYFDRGSFTNHISALQALEISLKGLFGVSGSARFVSNISQERIEYFLGCLGIILVVTSLAKFLKPPLKETQLSSENATKIRELLNNHGESDSLSYFALRDNKTVIWSKNGKAAIPYSIVSGVMITTGDPIGDIESWPSAIELFLQEAEKHAWIPAIYGCSEEAGEIWVRETDFDALEIGDEAILEVSSFSLEGSKMKNVRQTLNRIERLGYEVKTARISELTIVARDEMSSLMQSWRKSQTERGFSMALGRFCDPVDPDCLIVWAEKSDKTMAIFQFVPWGNNSFSLDIMRRSPESDTGVSELLILEAINLSKKLGYSEISLNFASFRSIFERGKKLGAGPITRASHSFLVFLSRFFQMESLYRFNAKFSPRWEPRYIVFPRMSDLIRVGYAILKIEAFIPSSNFKSSTNRGLSAKLFRSLNR